MARPVPFDDFAARLQRVYYGFVFTAHPTFGRTMELQTHARRGGLRAAQATLDPSGSSRWTAGRKHASTARRPSSTWPRSTRSR